MTVVEGEIVVRSDGALPLWKPGDSLLAALLSCAFHLDGDRPLPCVRCGFKFRSSGPMRLCPGPYTDSEKWRIAQAVARLPTAPEKPAESP